MTAPPMGRPGRRLAGQFICAFCGHRTFDPGSMVPIGGSAHACADTAACSDRMVSHGLGRRDWSAEQQEAMRVSLLTVLIRATEEEAVEYGAAFGVSQMSEAGRYAGK